MGLTIQKAERGDADMVAFLVHQLIEESFNGKDNPDPRQIQESAEKLLKNNNSHAIIAFDDDTPVGVMTIIEAVAVHARGKFAIIMEFFVLPQARSKGVGWKMVQYAENMAQKNGWHWLELCVPQGGDKEEAEAFFVRNGFQNMGPALHKRVVIRQQP